MLTARNNLEHHFLVPLSILSTQKHWIGVNKSMALDFVARTINGNKIQYVEAPLRILVPIQSFRKTPQSRK